MSTNNINVEVVKETFYQNYDRLLELKSDPLSPEYTTLKEATHQLLLSLSGATQ